MNLLNRFNSIALSIAALVIAINYFHVAWMWFWIPFTLSFILMNIYLVRMYMPIIKNVPVIPPNSLFGFTKALYSDTSLPTSHLDMLKVAEIYGKLAQFQLFGETIVLINDGAMAKEALKKIVGKGGYFHQAPFTHRNIFNLDTGEDWKMRRNGFRGAFSASQLSVKFYDVICSLCSHLCSKLETFADSNKPVEMDKLFGQLTVDVICRVAFCMDVNAIDDSTVFQSVHDSIRTRFESGQFVRMPWFWIARKLPISPFKEFEASSKVVDDFCKVIWKHVQTLENENRLQGFALALVEFSKHPEITEEDVISEIMLMFIAGHETTAHTLSWFIYSLAVNDDIQLQVQQRMDESEVRRADELPPYVEAVLKESMRKYTVAAFGSFRRVNDTEGFLFSSDDATKTPVFLPKGTWILVNFHVLHNSSLNWGTDAAEFKPERWLAGESADAETKTSDEDSEAKVNLLNTPSIFAGGGRTRKGLIFAPFSFGPRNCLGMNLALMETKIAISHLVSKYTFTLADDDLLDEEVAMEAHVTLRPHKKLPIFVCTR